MVAYQCSRCANLLDFDDYCVCRFDIDPRPGRRTGCGRKECLEKFESLQADQIWHERFFWEPCKM